MVLVHVLPGPRPRLDQLDAGREPRASSRASPRTTPAPGLVAYDGDAVVGWVSLGPREDYERLAYSKVLAPVDDTPVWSIVCFVVARRRAATASPRRLLGAPRSTTPASHGATTLEAYPVDTAGERIPSANAYHGHTVDVRAGRIRGRRTAPVRTPDSPARPIVRLAL